MLVLLHGANGSPREMQPLVRALEPHFELRVPALLGHARRPIPERYDFEAIAADLLQRLNREGIGEADFLGYSLGGYLALHLARHHPERVRTLATIAAKYVYDAKAVAHIAYLADPERVIRLGVRLELQKEAHGEDNWQPLLHRNRALFESFREGAPLDETDLRQVVAPALIVSGDADQLVPLEETRRLASLLPNARLATYVGQAHPITAIPAARLVRALRQFHADVASGGFVPGEAVELDHDLVAGGLAKPDLQVRLRKDSSKG
jgi:pimeloyl-ACP methyl ester carboxylesterase